MYQHGGASAEKVGETLTHWSLTNQQSGAMLDSGPVLEWGREMGTGTYGVG